MAGPSYPGLDTLALHAGQRPDPATGARAVPIHQTTSFVFEDCAHAASLFNLERAGHVDSHISNPTVAVLEERLAALEGGIGAVCTASGQAALHLAIATLMGQGGHIVASAALGGGTGTLLAHTLPRFGIDTTFVPPRDLAGFAAALRPATRLVLGETIGDPGLEVLDIPALAALAHGAGVPLLIDNTVATPCLSRPLALGADLVLHSATKWIGGHGTTIGGALVDGGRFDWLAGDKFPTLSQPRAGYWGLVFAEHFGPAALLQAARFEGLRDFGACLSPASAFQLLQGVETLPLRMRRHVENTAAVLAALAGNPALIRLVHPSLASHPDHALAGRLLPDGAGSVIGLGVRGGPAAAIRFIEALELASHGTQAGDAKTVVTHLGGDMVRLSVGLESPADIVADLGRALRASQKG